jgi:hypothetical protein
MAAYDPKVIQAFAEDLYSRAATIVVTNVLFFSVLGGIAGFFAMMVDQFVARRGGGGLTC